MTTRRRRLLALIAALTALSGCNDPVHAAPKDPPVDPAYIRGFGPNCSEGNPKYRAAKFDINNDGVADWFIAYRCPGKGADSKGDQLELFDGRGGAKPPLLGTHPVMHWNKGVRIYDGCLLFSFQRVLIARADGSVAYAGVWGKDGLKIDPRNSGAVPCADTSWAGSGVSS